MVLQMNDDFRDLLLALLGADAQFMIVGAYAVSVHGRTSSRHNLETSNAQLSDLTTYSRTNKLPLGLRT